MKKVGMVVAVEIQAAVEKYGKAERQETVGNMELYFYRMPGYELVAAHCGAGEIAAAAAAQLLISLYKCEVLVNFGVVGGLTPEMTLSKTCIVEKVVHYDWDISALENVKPGQYSEFESEYIPVNRTLFEKAREVMPELKPVIDASGDKFVAGEANKSRLHELYGADICEMEAAAVALVSYRNHIPCLMIKCVSDAITGGAEEFLSEINKASEACMEAVDQVIRSLL
ncbi:MAG: 5'-methylthioadenosine/S-adenosylhomocysteine nucleosidase [Lachnospiraceae bacterium]|nr:5'-methylthioadenosine/S-adenosylhomocysteine nucleosidase [Lachnospiraceae bacterium]